MLNNYNKVNFLNSRFSIIRTIIITVILGFGSIGSVNAQCPDFTPPTITCPVDQIGAVDGFCNYTVPDFTTLAITTDICTDPITVTQSPLAGSTISGAGTTVVTLTATDGEFFTSSCNFNLVVVDITAPTISCPGDQVGNVDALCSFALPNYTTMATALDNCPGVVVTQSPLPGTGVTVGTTNITLTATDVTGNSSNCSFNVIVFDIVIPTITCPSTQTESVDAGCNLSLPDYTGLATPLDNCSIASVTQSPIAGTTVGLGTTSVTITALDASGNSIDCSFNVNVIDNTNPTITCPGTQSGNVDATCSFSLPDYTLISTSGDNCSVASVTQSPLAGTSVSVGTTNIVITVIDGSGNSSNCNFNVTVTDIIDPVISCSGDQTGSVDGSCNFTIPNYISLITASDNCPGGSISQVPTIGTVVTTGTTNVVMTATDAAGNTATCSFDVVISDVFNPNISCPSTQNETVDAFCNLSLPDYTSLPPVSDNCGTVTVTQFPTPGTTVGLGLTNVVLTATDGSGNFKTCNFDVNVTDDIDPSIICPSTQSGTVDASCNFSIPNYIGLASPSDNCSVAGVTQSPVAGTIVTTGTTNIVLTVTDGSGNTSNCNFDVTVTDAINPTISCSGNQTASVNAFCNFTIPSYLALGTAADNCGSVTKTQTPAIGTVVSTGTTNVVITATDVAGNTATCSFDLIVTDDTAPVIACPSTQNETVNASCNLSLPDYTSAATASDNCGTVTVTQVPTPGTIVGLGTTNVVLTVTDGSSNTANCNFNVIVSDATDPTISCPGDQIGAVGGTCTFTLPSYIGLATTNDNCSVASVTQSPAAGTSHTVGTTNVVLTVTDGSGNTSSCNFNVLVFDITDPVISCPSNITINSDNGLCTSTAPIGTATGTDNCGTATITNDAPAAFVLGTTTVVWTANDGNGNIVTCNQVVTVVDSEDPVITCPSDITISANPGLCTSTASIGTATGTDNCGTPTIASDAPAAFILGTTTVVWTANDGNGNIVTCNQVVTVVDSEDPVITCPAAITINSDPGLCTSTAPIGTATGTDNCGTATITNNAPTAFPLGTTTVVWTANDGNGNSVTCNQVVTVVDSEVPVITCPIDITINSDNGLCTSTASIGTATGTDNCGTPAITNDAPATFPLGNTTVEWTANDGNGNFASCSQVVTVVDSEDPIITCPSDITINANPGLCTSTAFIGTATGTDNCGTPTITNDAPSAFVLGTTTVVWTANDGNGNIVTCNQVVTVIDNQNPTITCPSSITINTDLGLCTSTASIGTATGTDNCGTPTITNDAPGAFPIGTTTVVWTADDGNGNTFSCSQVVTVQDIEAPTAVCQNVSVYLDVTGNASIVATDVDGGSNDNCGAVTFSAIPTTFICANVGANNVTLTVTDSYTNTSTCTAIITVIDTVAPTAVCQNLTVYLDGTGNQSIIDSDIDGGSFDNCGAVTLTASQTAFGCADLGTNNINLTVVDVNGNTSNCMSVVTVLDTISPIVTCQNIDVYMTSGGTATIVGTDLNAGSFDNCSMVTFTANPSTFTCADLGTNNVTLTAFDDNGNSSTCTSIVTIYDTISPNAVCQNINAYLDASGNVSIVAADVDGGSNDNCSPVTISADVTSFTCAEIGANSVVLSVDDANGNSSSCTAIVTVVDTISPTAVCQNINTYLDAVGNASIAAADLDAGSSDVCGTVSFAASANAFICSDLGGNNVTLTVDDGFGNTSTCTSVVTVLDTVSPVMVCQNINAYLDGSGTASISASDVDGGSIDNCGSTTFNISPFFFNCSNAGANNVTLTGNDGNGNTSTCVSIVTVVDTISPVASCIGSLNIVLDGTGAASITGLDLENGSTDNCGVVSYSASPNVFSCADIGVVNVTFTVTDANGNSGSCVTAVTVDGSSVMSAMIDSETNPSGCGTSDGSIFSSATGGVLPYSYDWNSGAFNTQDITSLTAGTYSLVVTDVNGCIANTSTSLSDAGGPTVAVDTTIHVECNGASSGAIGVTTTGGAAPYAFSWNSGAFTTEDITGLPAGSYNLTVTDNGGCAGNVSVTVLESTPITIGVASTDATCGLSNGSIDLTVNGGNSPYTYDWNSGAFTTEDLDSLAPGTYAAVVADSLGCIQSTSLTIVSASSAVVASTTSVTDVTCNNDSDGSIDIEATGGAAPYIYDWDNDGTGENDDTQDQITLTAGTYIVIVYDQNSCSDTLTHIVVEPAAVDTSVVQNDIELTANSATGTFEWIDCGTMTAISGETGATFTATTNGDYAVVVTEGACSDTSACYNISTVGIASVSQQELGLVVYPNPNEGQFSLLFKNYVGDIKYTVFDLEGRMIVDERTQVLNGQNIEVDLGSVETGMYLLQVITDNGMTTTRVVKH